MGENKLEEVLVKAANEPEFFDSLLRDVNSTLQSAGMMLSQEDNLQLQELLRGPVEVGTEVLFRTIHDLMRPAGVPWAPPPWQPKRPA